MHQTLFAKLSNSLWRFFSQYMVFKRMFMLKPTGSLFKALGSAGVALHFWHEKIPYNTIDASIRAAVLSYYSL